MMLNGSLQKLNNGLLVDSNNIVYVSGLNGEVIPLTTVSGSKLRLTNKNNVFVSMVDNQYYTLNGYGQLQLLDGHDKESNNQKVKEDIAKTYGLSLDDIEQVKLENGKEFFKFYNPKDFSIRMLENNDYNNNLSVQFKDDQQQLTNAQKENSDDNAKAIFDYQHKYEKKEITLIPIVDLENNFTQYSYVFNSLDSKQILAIKTLIKCSEELELRYINIENALAIDQNNRVINAFYNPRSNEYEVRQATVMRYDDDKVLVDDNNIEIELDNIDFDMIVKEIDVASDEPVEIAGEQIYPSQLKKFNDYSDNKNLIDNNQNLSNKQKSIYRRLVEAYRRMTMSKAKQKVYTKKDSHAAFANIVLLSLLTGFFGGMFFMIVILFLKAQI